MTAAEMIDRLPSDVQRLARVSGLGVLVVSNHSGCIEPEELADMLSIDPELVEKHDPVLLVYPFSAPERPESDD